MVHPNSTRALFYTRQLKSCMVDVKHMLLRPNRVQPTDDVSEMNRRSQALAKLLKHSLKGEPALKLL